MPHAMSAAIPGEGTDERLERSVFASVAPSSGNSDESPGSDAVRSTLPQPRKSSSTVT